VLVLERAQAGGSVGLGLGFGLSPSMGSGFEAWRGCRRAAFKGVDLGLLLSAGLFEALKATSLGERLVDYCVVSSAMGELLRQWT
jgi:hypothetical protein